jgi:cystathionine beta-lyase/cystathionine gamma-synthase
LIPDSSPRIFRTLFFSWNPQDPYRGQGTKYLHLPDERGHHQDRNENPSGAVVLPISLATTFKQQAPGKATAPEDPNSFGLGYEYSRTGKFILRSIGIQTSDDLSA